MMMSDFVVSSILDSGLMNYTFPLKIMRINYKAETELHAGARVLPAEESFALKVRKCAWTGRYRSLY